MKNEINKVEKEQFDEILSYTIKYNIDIEILKDIYQLREYFINSGTIIDSTELCRFLEHLTNSGVMDFYNIKCMILGVELNYNDLYTYFFKHYSFERIYELYNIYKTNIEVRNYVK